MFSSHAVSEATGGNKISRWVSKYSEKAPSLLNESAYLGFYIQTSKSMQTIKTSSPNII